MISAIIPARGGSKRLPGKNIALFAGRPLLAWSILAARAAPSVGGVWVTTDDASIAAVAREYGAEVIDRPADLARDGTLTVDAIIHAAQEIETRVGTIEAAMTLQPTNPLRPVEMIEEAVANFRAVTCDSLVAVSQRPLKTGDVVDGYFRPSYSFCQPSQHTAPLTYENGILYISRRDTLLETRSLCGERILAFVTERPFDDVDIDEEQDLVIGEAVFQAVADRLGY